MIFFEKLSSANVVAFSLFALFSTQQANAFFWPFINSNVIERSEKEKWSKVHTPILPASLKNEDDREHCEFDLNDAIKGCRDRVRGNLNRVKGNGDRDIKSILSAWKNLCNACAKSEKECDSARLELEVLLRLVFEHAQESYWISQNHNLINEVEEKAKKLLKEYDNRHLNPVQDNEASVEETTGVAKDKTDKEATADLQALLDCKEKKEEESKGL